MAHKLAAGSTRNGRDSKSKRLGVKKYGGEVVTTGQILVRQRGTKFHPGAGVKRTGDDTIIAVASGNVLFTHKKVRAFTGNLQDRTFVNVI